VCCGLAQLDAHTLGVAVNDGDAIAVRGETERCGLKATARCRAQQLGYLFLQLLFLILDVRNHVAEDVQRSHAGIPAPLTACMVLTKSFSMPKRACSGASGSTSPIAQQLGFVTR
jgi:hypothetical protein